MGRERMYRNLREGGRRGRERERERRKTGRADARSGPTEILNVGKLSDIFILYTLH